MTTEMIEQISAKYPVNVIRVHGLDDDETVIEIVSEQLAANSINFQMFTEQDDFIAELDKRPQICFVDYQLPGKLNGVQITKIIMDQYPDCKVIMITGNKDWNVLWEFHNKAAGWRFVEKKDHRFINDLVYVIQEAIVEIKYELEFKMEVEEWRAAYAKRKKRIKERETNNSSGV